MKRLFKQFLAFFPTKVPTGVPAFNAWAESFFDIYDLPAKNIDSVKAALAMMIAHADNTKLRFLGVYRSKYYYYLQLNASASRQVALAVHKELYDAFQNKKSVVISPEASSNVTPLNKS